MSAGEEFAAAIASLTSLLKDQAEAANQREQRMADLVTQALRGRQGSASGDDDDSQTSDTTNSRPRLPPSATPAPRLVCSASLREFSSWREKYKGYRLLTGLDSLDIPEQRAALLTLLDDEWTRVIRYSLDVTDATPIDTLLTKMESHLRSQRNVIVDRKEFHTRQQADGEPFDEYVMALTLAGPGEGRFSPPPLANICDNSRTLRDRKAKLSVPFPTSILHLLN